MIGAVPPHRRLGGLGDRQRRVLLHLRLDRLDHHDGVIDHDADGEHHREQRDGVGRIAHRVHHHEGGDQADGHGDEGDQRRAQRAEEEEDHQPDEDEGLDQGVDHHLDGQPDEGGGVVGDDMLHAFGKARGKRPHGASDGFRGADRIGPGGEVDPDADGRLPVQRHRLVLVPGAELDARDVAHAQHRAIRIGTHQDGAELLRIREPAGGADVELVGGVVARRLRPDAPERRDLVLRADGVHDVGRGQAERGQAVGLEPDAHGVVAGAEHLRIAHAVHLALDRLGDGRLNHLGRGAGEEGGDRELRRHDVGELRDRDLAQRDQPGDGHDDGDDDREPRPVHEDLAGHRLSRSSAQPRAGCAAARAA